MGIPAEDDGGRTDEAHKSAHISPKDLKWIIGGLVVFFAILTPIYQEKKRDAEKVRCKGNFGEINQAILAYAEQHDGRLPAMYVDYGGAPLLEKGAALTWVAPVSAYMSDDFNFVCPSADSSENTRALSIGESEAGNEIDTVSYSSYGMYSAYSVAPIESIQNKAQTVLIAETANRGAQRTYDPLPLIGPDGKPAPYDGAVIGWNDSNGSPTQDTRAVTRLAFYGSDKGVFNAEMGGRHRSGNHFLFLDGHYETLNAPAALVRMSPSGPVGYWEVPPTLITDR